ncbi:putative transcription factor interactor and regulator CCHC(Zn) family protein [Tanacetum coccineum]
MWSCAMKFALRNKNMLGFIDGTCKRDSNSPAMAYQWDMCNSVVVTWILGSLSPELYAGQIYSKTALDMWNDLKETYDKVDGSVIFILHKSINSLSQNRYALSEYYHNLNSMWKQFDAMLSLPVCTCDVAKHFEKHNQLIKLMQFLTGLDDAYLSIRSNILTRDPLPSVKTTFIVVSGEKSHRSIASIGTSPKPSATAFEVDIIKKTENQAKMTKLSMEWKLNDYVTLFNVLVIPEYIVNLLSIHRLTKDSKFFVVVEDSGPSQGLYLCRIVLRYRCFRTELITPNLICPSTHQLLRSSGGDSGPDLSFDKSASLECLFSLAHVSLAGASKLPLSSGCSEGDYTS